MKSLGAFFLLGAHAAVAANPPGSAAVAEAIPPARDGDIAIAQELCAARRAGTVEAYDLFLARHPVHTLAAVAKAERAKLARSR